MPSSRLLVALALSAVLGISGCAQLAAPSSTPSASGPTLVANYRLFIHCSAQYAIFDGDNWEAVPPIPSIPPYVQDGKGKGSGRNEIAGQMVRLSATEARFTTTEDPVGVVIHYVTMTGQIPGCA
jgi:hypothetical protein